MPGRSLDMSLRMMPPPLRVLKANSLPLFLPFRGDGQK
jgi:hypothetical protein